MRVGSAAIVVAFGLLLTGGCGGGNTHQAAQLEASTSEPPPPTITKAVFDPVYRASKALQGATVAGVSYADFRTALQRLATEIGIAKDHQLTDPDRRLLSLYEDAYSHYANSAVLWDNKVAASDDRWKGEIPIALGKKVFPSAALAKQYHIAVSDRAMNYTGEKYQVIPGDSVSVIWKSANEAIGKATAMYYAGH